MHDHSILLPIAIVVLAGITSGTASFGFAPFAVPPLLLIIDPPTVTAIVLLLLIVTQSFILIGARKDVAWPLAIGVLPFAILGITGGAHVLLRLEPVYIQLVASAVVMGFAWLLLRGVDIAGANSSGAIPISGFFSGVLGVTTGMSGPPVIILISARRLSKNAIRGTLSFIFLVIDVTSIAHLVWHGLLIRDEMEDALVLIPAAIVGVEVGKRLAKRIAQDQFRTVVLSVLIISGVLGVARALRVIA